jgi:choline-sulfatase
MFENLFGKKPNILILMTDQQRKFKGFPEDWISKNLKNYRRLQKHGLTFNRGMCNACRCSPSRSVLITGNYTSQTKVLQVGQTLSPDQNGLGDVAKAAGYNMIYKGKWHLTKEYDAPSRRRPVNTKQAKEFNEKIDTEHGMGHWNFPDAGNALVMNESDYQSLPPMNGKAYLESPAYTLGGDEVQNDHRIVHGKPYGISDEEGAIAFLQNYQKKKNNKPFCMVVSLVNPHDASVYPHAIEKTEYWKDHKVWQNYKGFKIPETALESLAGRPEIHKTYLNTFDGGVTLDDAQLVENLQFYAYLHTLTDKLFDDVMDAMSPELIENTIIIRIADHGEMAGAHSGMREKDFNAYAETMNIPFVVSNPKLFPTAQSSEALVGLVDIVPTLAAIMGGGHTPKGFRFKGNDFSKLLVHRAAAFPDRALFTFDDYENPKVKLKHIRCIVKAEYKFVVYYRHLLTDDIAPKVDTSAFHYELFHIAEDEHERSNLLPTGVAWSPDQVEMCAKYYAELTELMSAENTDTTPPGWPIAPPPNNYIVP